MQLQEGSNKEKLVNDNQKNGTFNEDLNEVNDVKERLSNQYMTMEQREMKDEGMKRMGYSAVPSSVGSKRGLESYQSHSNYKEQSDKSRNQNDRISGTVQLSPKK